MARDGVSPTTETRPAEGQPGADQRRAQDFGPLHGGALIHWQVEERRL
uniref:Uncharacterized protein n=1 Tax=Brevundimonas basaltis TaxID=472166 RepID=A0A7W8HZ15_9CAUL|nr:hypothetical protein [Brevundimonas basaltis]